MGEETEKHLTQQHLAEDEEIAAEIEKIMPIKAEEEFRAALKMYQEIDVDARTIDDHRRLYKAEYKYDFLLRKSHGELIVLMNRSEASGQLRERVRELRTRIDQKIEELIPAENFLAHEKKRIESRPPKPQIES